MTFGLSANISTSMGGFDPQMGGSDVSHLLRRARALPLAPAEKKKVQRIAKAIESEEEEKTRPGADLRKMYGNS